jgi:hypothetical protein
MTTAPDVAAAVQGLVADGTLSPERATEVAQG